MSKHAANDVVAELREFFTKAAPTETAPDMSITSDCALSRRMRVEFELRQLLATELLSTISAASWVDYVGGGRAFGGLTREDRVLAAGMLWARVKRNTTPLEESMLVAKYTVLHLSKKTSMEASCLKRKILAVEAVSAVMQRNGWSDLEFEEVAFAVASWADLRSSFPAEINYWKNRKRRVELINTLRERNKGVLTKLYPVLIDCEK